MAAAAIDQHLRFPGVRIRRVEPVESTAALTPLFAQRSIGRRSSMARNLAFAKCWAAAGDCLNQPSLVTLMITWVPAG